jgi:peptidoglycan/LPS O-acetylase OafA/YrhL
MKNTRVNEVDLLRILAVMAVVLYHYGFRGFAADDMSVMPYPILSDFAKYGYLGVDLFFMISGFVILMTASKASLKSFIISRIVRLYPAFWACCTITFAMIVTIGGVRYSATISQYLINMTMLSGFIDVPAIDGAYWSLFVEIKFYVLVAAVLIIGRIHQAQLFISLWLIASVALEVFPIGKLCDFLIVDYSAYFIAGAAYFMIWSQRISLTRVLIIIFSWGLALFESINTLPSFEKHYNTVMNSYVVAGIITAFFFVMCLVSFRKTAFLGRKRWLLASVITYPLYLLHQNIGFMIFNIAYPKVNQHLLLWGTVLLSIGAAYAVHIFVEKKFSPTMKTFLYKIL